MGTTGPSLGHLIALPLFFLCPISLSPFPLPQLSDSTSSLWLELQGPANSPPTPNPRRLSASGPEHSVLPLSSLSALLLNSLRLLLLAIAYTISIALETGVVQAGKTHNVDFINFTAHFISRWGWGVGFLRGLGTSLPLPLEKAGCSVCVVTLPFGYSSHFHAQGVAMGPFHRWAPEARSRSPFVQHGGRLSGWG